VAACCLLAAAQGAQAEAPPDEGPSLPRSQPGEPEGLAPLDPSALPAAHARPIPLGITVSGAVSLGAWQAGFLYYLAETIKRNPEQLELHLLTGASAGTINALLTAMEISGEPVDDPRESLFWSMWNEFTYEEIFDVSQTQGPYLSSGAVLQALADQLELEWLEGIDADIDLVLGAAVTRLEHRRVDLGDGLTVPRNQEHFVLRLQGKGPGRPPAVSNYVDVSAHLPQLLLPVDGADPPPDPQAEFEVISELLLASSALPGAFEPRVIGYCETPLADPGQGCVEGDQSTRFIDGAISDRHPLRLGWRLADMGMSQGVGGSLAWLDRPQHGRDGVPADMLFLYMDPTHASYPRLPAPEGVAQGGSTDKILATFAGLAGDLAGAAQASELHNLAEENPELSNRLALVEPTIPPVSGELFKFFGFFDRRFRRYDFFLGMADARRLLDELIQPRVLERHDRGLSFPEPQAANEFWRPYACIRAVVDGDGDPGIACADEDQGGMEVLLQTSIDRLWDHCRRLPATTRTEHALCQAAIQSTQARPRVPNVEVASPPRAWQRRGPYDNLEGDFDYLSRLLELYSFEYRDFGLSRRQAWLGTSYLREEMGGMVSAYGQKLDGRSRMLVLGGGKPALNLLHYAPPITIIHLGLGSGLELGASSTGRLVPSRWLRFHTALQIDGLGRFLSPQPNVVTLNPMIGLELEHQRLSGALLQPRLVGRIGWQYSSGDRWASRSCDTAAFDDDPMRCSVPVAQGLVVMSVFERLRFQLGLRYDFGFYLGEPTLNDDAFTAMSGVGFQWISPFVEEPRRRITRHHRARAQDEERP
jgi:predicted acylesterase/phospholipase RssA